MNILITDNMLKEAKACKKPAVIIYVLAVVMPLAQLVAKWVFETDKYTNKDILLTALAYFSLGSIVLYNWLYAIKYKLTITETQISVRTLFRSFQIDISEITHYTCKRYRKSEFYQFKLFAKNKGLLISTRYCNELISLLSKNNILEKH